MAIQPHDVDDENADFQLGSEHLAVEAVGPLKDNLRLATSLCTVLLDVVEDLTDIYPATGCILIGSYAKPLSRLKPAQAALYPVLAPLMELNAAFEGGSLGQMPPGTPARELLGQYSWLLCFSYLPRADRGTLADLLTRHGLLPQLTAIDRNDEQTSHWELCAFEVPSPN